MYTKFQSNKKIQKLKLHKKGRFGRELLYTDGKTKKWVCEQNRPIEKSKRIFVSFGLFEPIILKSVNVSFINKNTT